MSAQTPYISTQEPRLLIACENRTGWSFLNLNLMLFVPLPKDTFTVWLRECMTKGLCKKMCCHGNAFIFIVFRVETRHYLGAHSHHVGCSVPCRRTNGPPPQTPTALHLPRASPNRAPAQLLPHLITRLMHCF